MAIDFHHETDVDLIQAYSKLLREMKSRKIICSKNLVGDLGEYLAIDCYKKTPGLANLSSAPAGCRSFDAVGMNGKTYSVKSTSGNVTGSFFGLSSLASGIQDKPTFNFLIIVQFDSDYSLKRIIELNWAMFVEYRKWLPSQNAYNIPVTQKVVAAAKLIYPTPTSVI